MTSLNLEKPIPPSFPLHNVMLVVDGLGCRYQPLQQAVSVALQTRGRLLLTYLTHQHCNNEGTAEEKVQVDEAYGTRLLERLARYARHQGLTQVETFVLEHQSMNRLGRLAGQIGADIIILACHNSKQTICAIC